MGPGEFEWHHAPEAWAEDFGIWEKQLVEFLPQNERDEIQTWARPDDFVRYGRRALVGLRADNVKAVSIVRNCVSLSSCQKTFNSKLIKFSTWTNLVNVLYFGFLYMFMNILWFHISVSWVCYILTAVPGTFYIPESQCFSSAWTVFFTKARNGKPMFRPFINILTKTYFSILIRHSSVNFTWFALCSKQKLINRTLLKPVIWCRSYSFKINIKNNFSKWINSK